MRLPFCSGCTALETTPGSRQKKTRVGGSGQRWAAAGVCPKQNCRRVNAVKHTTTVQVPCRMHSASLISNRLSVGLRFVRVLWSLSWADRCTLLSILEVRRSSRRSSSGGTRFSMASSHRMARASDLCLAFSLVVLMCSFTGEARSVNLGQTQAVPQRICDACLQFSTEAQLILSDPRTQKQVIDMLTQKACNSLTPKLKTECSTLVNTYVSDAFIALQAFVRPEVCTEAGFCMMGSTSYISARGRLLDQTRLGDAKTCVLCQDFARDALSYLGTNATKSKIIGALHLACSRLEDISRHCDLLVDVYAPEVMEHLDDLTPEELCDITHLCTLPRKPVLARRGVRANNCAICQFVVLEVKLKLRDPVTQESLLEALLSGCNRVKNHVDECKMIVTQYAPFILQNLDSILDADAVCSRIGACKVHKLNAVESVLASVLEGNARHHIHVL